MAEPRYCSGCGSPHIGLRCEPGTKYRDRLLGAQIHGSVTPSKDKRDYWNDDGLEEITGHTRNERREQMADATQGRGYTTMADVEATADD